MHRNWSLVVGIALPLLLILFVLLAVLLPSWFASPGYSFLYTDSPRRDYPDYQLASSFDVQGDRVVELPIPEPVYPRGDPGRPAAVRPSPKLFVYDPQTDRSREVTLIEAQQWALDTNRRSPDGYTLEFGRDHGGIFEIFGGFDRSGQIFLKKGLLSKRIYLDRSLSDRLYYSFQPGIFLGWIVGPNPASLK